jgi:hypothetical protein
VIEAAKNGLSLEWAFRIAYASGQPLDAVFEYAPPKAKPRR